MAAVTCQSQTGKFPLESLVVSGTGMSRETVLEIAGLRIGQPVDKAAIEAGCAKLQESGLFESIAFKYAPGPKHGYVVTLTLSELREVTGASIDVAGVDEAEVWKWLAGRYPSLDRKVPANDASQRFVAARIQEHLASQLGGQSVVARMETDLRTHRSMVSFQPESLPRVSAMVFSGQHELASEKLASLLEKVVADFGYTDRRFRDMVEFNLRPAYEDHGMYRVQFLRISTQKLSPSTLTVSTEIEEGPKYILRDVQLVGDHLPTEPMLKAATFKKGEIANWTAIQRSIWDMEKPLKRTGYFDASAKPERIFEDQQHLLDLRIAFAMGPLYHFGELKIIGLSPALEAQARKIWKMKAGDPFDYEYSNDFFREFFQSTDPRQFKKSGAAMQRHAGEAVMDINLLFEGK
jgi:outer membrane protein assembly factor BamA